MVIKISAAVKRKRFNKICKDIKDIKIQGARNIAKAALKAYNMFPTQASKKKLLSLRATEPMLKRMLDEVESSTYKEVLAHSDQAQEKINKIVLKLLKAKDKILFTHCHSTNVTGAIINAKEKGKKFEVYNTETRPLFQGRKTSRELSKAGINVTQFVDSAVGIALSKEQSTKNVNIIFVGADALIDNGVVNKVGSETIAKLAKMEKIPFYVIADSWKYSKEKVPMEQRGLNEVWDKAPKKVKIKNPAFEFIDKKYITGIVTELGLRKYGDFLKAVKKKR